MNNAHQFAGIAGRWSFFAATLTSLAVSSPARAQCPVVMTEYKTGTAQRIKTGHPAFISQTNTFGSAIIPVDSYGDFKFYRQYDNELDLSYLVTCPSGNCTHDLYTIHTTTWPSEYEPEHVISDQTECGTVTNYVTTSIGTFDYTSGTISCSQTMTNNDWTPDCGEIAYCGGSRYGYTNSVLSETLRQVTFTFTNSHACSGMTGEEVRTETLSTLYTTSELVANMTEDALTMLATNKASVSGAAYLNLEERGRCGTAGAMRFRYKVFGARGTETPVVFKVNYWALYRSGGTATSGFQYSTSKWSVVVSNHVVCTGSVQISPEYEYEPFYGDGVRASLITIEMIAPASCGGDLPGFAQAEIHLGEGPFAAFGLGTCMGTAYPGFLYLSTMSPDPDIDRSYLAPFTHAALTETVEDEGGLSEVIVGQKMAKVTDASGGFTVTYYSSTNAEQGSFVASYTVAVQSVSPAYRLRVTSSDGWYNEFVYTNGWWYLDRGNGHLGEAWQGIVDTEGIVRTNSFSLLGSGGAVLYTETTRFDVLATGHVVPTNRVVGSGGDATTHTWIYNTGVATNHVTYGKLSWEIDGQGNWERHTYDDTSGLRTKTVSAFGNAATNAADNASRVFEFGYTPFLAGDDGTIRPEVPRFIVEKVEGIVVSQTAVALWPSNTLESRFAAAGSTNNYNWPSNLITTVTEFALPNGTGTRTLLPGGTATLSYALTNSTGAYLTNLVLSGKPSTNPTNIVDGARSVTISTLPDGRTLSQASFDIVSGKKLDEQTYSYTADTSYTVTYLDGTSESYTNATCCGVGSYVDRDGTLTEHSYDTQRRLIATKRLGIITSNVLDAAGRTLESWRIPTSGSAVRTAAYTYDTAGRLKTRTDAMGNTWTNVYGFAGDGRSTLTVNAPDGSHQIDYHNKDGTLERVIGTSVFPVRYVYDVDGAAPTYRPFFVEEIKLGEPSEYDDTYETVRTYQDLLGRSVRVVYPDTAAAQTRYELDRMSSQTDPDGFITVFEYNDTGELSATGADLNQNYALNSGSDRRTRTVTDYITKESTWDVRRTISYAWNDSGVEVAIATNEVSLDGLRSWHGSFGRVTRTQTVYGGGGSRTVTTTAPDGSYVVEAYSYGRLESTTRYNSGDVQIARRTYAYDAHGRQHSSTDARASATTTILFDANDQAVSNTLSASGLASQLTRFIYDSMGRVTRTIHPDGTSVTNEYFLTGLLKKTYGSRTYPVEYTYSSQGRLLTMKTWQGFATGSGAATTAWVYNGQRGFMTNKTYAGSSPGPGYGYTSGGRLLTRRWARGTTTTYGYNNAGDLASVDYSDSTPDVSYTYDRFGRRLTQVQGTGGEQITTSFTYDSLGNLRAESHSGGFMGSLSVTNGFDALSRPIATALASQTATLVGYGYDTASRLIGVTNGSYSATYSYLANASLIDQIIHRQTSTVRMTTTRVHDNFDRLQSIASTNQASGKVSAHAYAYNDANQRTQATLADDSYWSYTYDELGQVISGKRHWAGGTPVAGQQFEYDYDDIGNRKYAGSGGNEWGSNLRYENYTANTLNQYTQRTVPGAVDVLGAANTNATVTVNHQPSTRQGEYFRAEVPVGNGAEAVYLSVTNIGVFSNGSDPDIVTTTEGSLFIPRSPELLSYDADGNLTSSGRWTNRWDGENRLIEIESLPLSEVPDEGKVKVAFRYDGQSRRIGKTVWSWNGSTWTTNYTRKFLWNGWNLVAELDALNALVRSYAWGLDLSGTSQGAGGVGGLLMVNVAGGSVHFPACDGNGNVIALVDGADSSVSAVYEYDPFGKLLRSTGPVAPTNPFRFSTKYQDNETGLLYYGYRYYDPETGRWPSRDPIDDPAFRHATIQSASDAWVGFATDRESMALYAFLRNDPLSFYDALGLCPNFCGVDVGNALNLSREDIKQRFRDLDRPAKLKACAPYRALLDRPTKDIYDGIDGWDLDDLIAPWENSLMKGKSCGDCKFTVTVDGKCYNVWDVNYYSFGVLGNLCGFSLVDTKRMVRIWKTVTLKSWTDDVEAAASFAHWGYMGSDGNNIFVATKEDLTKSCAVCSEKYPKHLSSVWPKKIESPK